MATKHQIRRLAKLEAALRRIVMFTMQSRDARTGAFKKGSTVTPEAFRRASSLVGVRAPVRPRPTFGPRPGELDAAPVVRPRNRKLRAEIIAALKSRKPTR